ncbi:unnamed protein product [Gongylonema pulchrum]|uniref:Protein kinase domain-containing protein n=1 Tax=Gongylonema pulchrum TaxID=637853 RepID=A0A183EE08_9BILA|nr:unnamed protein product [Gongylonema pulchrum]
MKVESRDLDHNDQLLRVEATILKRMQHSEHVPVFIAAGNFQLLFLNLKLAAGRTAIFNFILMELLGKSLSELHKATPHRQFTIATVLKVALQALSALRDLHSVYFVHRDVKPGNFATGLKNVNVLYILDFGLSRQFATFDPGMKALKLRKPRPRASFRGTVAYCSINVHKHLEQGRHDDLWSMMYMLIEFIAGRLPWKGLDRKEIAVIKQTISKKKLQRQFELTKSLNKFKGCPKQFGIILEYLSTLRYFHRPDYEQIENLFVIAIQRRNIDRKAPFEWGLPKPTENAAKKTDGEHENEAEKLNKPEGGAPTAVAAASAEALNASAPQAATAISAPAMAAATTKSEAAAQENRIQATTQCAS